jgi:hypothetical protein
MNFCIDCKYYSGLCGDGRWAWEKPCLRPGLVNLITGDQTVSCFTERYTDVHTEVVNLITGKLYKNYSDRKDCCGREGKYFIRKSVSETS